MACIWKFCNVVSSKKKNEMFKTKFCFTDKLIKICQLKYPRPASVFHAYNDFVNMYLAIYIFESIYTHPQHLSK